MTLHSGSVYLRGSSCTPRSLTACAVTAQIHAISLCSLPSLTDTIFMVCPGALGLQLMMEKRLFILYYLTKPSCCRGESVSEIAHLQKKAPPRQGRPRHRHGPVSCPMSCRALLVKAHSHPSESHQGCGLSQPWGILNHPPPAPIFHNLLGAWRLLDLNS